MTGIDELFEGDRSAPEPAGGHVANSLYTKGVRRARRRRAATVAATGLAVVAVVLGVALDLPNISGKRATAPDDQLPLPSAPMGTEDSFAWAGMGDRDHLYVSYLNCPDPPTPVPSPTGPPVLPPCVFELRASADGGATWEARPAPAPDGIHLLFDVWGTEILYARTPMAYEGGVGLLERISFDGGRHWAPLVHDPTPLDALPDGAEAVCHSLGSDCSVAAADPVTRTIRPLRNQPPLFRPSINPNAVPHDRGLWASGLDPSNRQPAVATSSDRGRTWSTHILPGGERVDEDVFGGTISIYTADGRTVYAMTYAPYTVRRSTDGGVTWGWLEDLPRPPTSFDMTVVTADNAHLLSWNGQDENRLDKVYYAMSRDGGPYTNIPTPPLSIEALRAVRAMIGGGFLTVDASGVFRSDDGLNWRRILPCRGPAAAAVECD